VFIPSFTGDEAASVIVVLAGFTTTLIGVEVDGL
jgi:hypothetical protein